MEFNIYTFQSVFVLLLFIAGCGGPGSRPPGPATTSTSQGVSTPGLHVLGDTPGTPPSPPCDAARAPSGGLGFTTTDSTSSSSTTSTECASIEGTLDATTPGASGSTASTSASLVLSLSAPSLTSGTSDQASWNLRDSITLTLNTSPPESISLLNATEGASSHLIIWMMFNFGGSPFFIPLSLEFTNSERTEIRLRVDPAMLDSLTRFGGVPAGTPFKLRALSSSLRPFSITLTTSEGFPEAAPAGDTGSTGSDGSSGSGTGTSGTGSTTSPGGDLISGTTDHSERLRSVTTDDIIAGTAGSGTTSGLSTASRLSTSRFYSGLIPTTGSATASPLGWQPEVVFSPTLFRDASEAPLEPVLRMRQATDGQGNLMMAWIRRQQRFNTAGMVIGYRHELWTRLLIRDSSTPDNVRWLDPYRVTDNVRLRDGIDWSPLDMNLSFIPGRPADSPQVFMTWEQSDPNDPVSTDPSQSRSRKIFSSVLVGQQPVWSSPTVLVSIDGPRLGGTTLPLGTPYPTSIPEHSCLSLGVQEDGKGAVAWNEKGPSADGSLPKLRALGFSLESSDTDHRLRPEGPAVDLDAPSVAPSGSWQIKQITSCPSIHNDDARGLVLAFHTYSPGDSDFPPERVLISFAHYQQNSSGTMAWQLPDSLPHFDLNSQCSIYDSSRYCPNWLKIPHQAMGLNWERWEDSHHLIWAPMIGSRSQYLLVFGSLSSPGISMNSIGSSYLPTPVTLSHLRDWTPNAAEPQPIFGDNDLSHQAQQLHYSLVADGTIWSASVIQPNEAGSGLAGADPTLWIQYFSGGWQRVAGINARTMSDPFAGFSGPPGEPPHAVLRIRALDFGQNLQGEIVWDSSEPQFYTTSFGATGFTPEYGPDPISGTALYSLSLDGSIQRISNGATIQVHSRTARDSAFNIIYSSASPATEIGVLSWSESTRGIIYRIKR